MKKPYLFDEFLASGLEESVSPFLTATSRGWGKNLALRCALLATALLITSFILSFLIPSLSSLLLCLCFFIVGTPALIAAFNDLKNLEINISVLMTMAAFLAILVNSSIEGALLLVLFNLSHAMEHNVSKKARSALNNLNRLAPKFATLLDTEGRFYEKSIREIQIGEIIFVKNGEIIPLDGKVVKGISTLNLSHLTGESTPITKTINDPVPAGAINLESALSVEVTRTSHDSTLSKIMQLILSAQKAKPKLQDLLDRFGKKYATTIICLTFLFALILPYILSTTFFGFEGSIYRALAFLIAASPCALIIATPTAYLSAISSCAKKGILLKGGITLDALAKCKTIAFDKTGTLTTGELVCTDFEPLLPTNISKEEALSIALGLEQHVVHPIAKAIHKLAEEKNVSAAEISDFKAVPGSGVEGTHQNMSIAIGLPTFVASQLSNEKPVKGKIRTYLKIGDALFLFQFSDEIREDTAGLLKKITTSHQIRSVMLTGDHASSAHQVGTSLGIEEIFADLRPQDKLDKVAELAESGNLAMVGDGINDAPALARANVGISMGKVGSGTAVDASDVVLLNDDLQLLPWLFHKSYKTRRIVKQNIALSLAVICFASIPALLGLVPLWAAVVLHEGGTVLVGFNSLRLLKSK